MTLKRIWAWIQENSSALQGVAALLVIIGTLVAMFSFTSKALRPDVVVRVKIDDSTVPSEIVTLLSDLKRSIRWESAFLEEMKNENNRLYNILNSPDVKRLDLFSHEFDKARIEILNQSDNVVSGVRLRLDHILGIWGIDVNGTFLRESDATLIEEGLLRETKDGSIVAPELPPLPPNSSIELILTGNVSSLEPKVTTTGHSFSVVRVTEVEDGTLIYWYQHPAQFLWLLLMFTPFAVVMFFSLWPAAIRRAVKRERKNTLYNIGCELALETRGDEAMILLVQAVEAGYQNRQHALKDEDLEILRDRDDFRELFRKTNPKKAI